MGKKNIVIISILIASSLFSSSEACNGASEDCGVSTYWGQNHEEGSLLAACESGLYEYVNVGFLTTFGCYHNPVINLDDHDASSLVADIKACQDKGIKVLLSIGGAGGNDTICSPENAKEVADYLWENYLAPGNAGVLGDATFDGIDFYVEALSNLYWDDLVKALAAYSSAEKKVYLSAAPQCPYPDYYLDAAIKTGCFDYISVHFFDNAPCDYSGGIDSLLASWNKWSSSLPEGNKLFLGLPASREDASSGYIEPEELTTKVLPLIKSSPNYGGVMVFDRLFDVRANYTAKIKPAVCDDGTALHRRRQKRPFISMV
ncbi:Hevamine-A [Sesamum alatum]|uniref:chitinase n=1 Tax=Sesamum alatum TaxID=300844 RepID=A0AAE1YUD8_9LAMI|nr:Hevamine-A [Sesamum alatum]